MLCDACGKNMTMSNKETTLVGIQIRLVAGEAADESTRRWYAEQIAPFELNREYTICFPCWPHSLGVRPDCPADNPVPGDPLIVYRIDAVAAKKEICYDRLGANRT